MTSDAAGRAVSLAGYHKKLKRCSAAWSGERRRLHGSGEHERRRPSAGRRAAGPGRLATPADGAARHPGAQVPGLERLLLGLAELAEVVDGGQPVGEGGGEVVAPSVAVTFDERSRPEVLQTGAGRHQRLAAALGSRVRVLPGGAGQSQVDMRCGFFRPFQSSCAGGW